METTEEQVVKDVEMLKKKFAKDEKVQEFDKTNQHFEDLVKKGVIQKRGNNLLSASDAHVKRKVWFNTK